MLKNYLTIALRNLRKHKGYALLNVAGLALGLAAFALILLFVRDELSYDRHHPLADRIVRVGVDIEASEGATRTAQTPPVWPTRLVETFPEIEDAVRFKPPRQSWMVRHEERTFVEKTWTFADSSVFTVFDVPLLRGDATTALSAPNTVVLSESAATKYFGDENPIGQVLTLDNQYDFEVTGVFADMARTGHFHFEFLASFVSLNDPSRLYLFNALEGVFPFSYTYLLLDEDTDAEALEARIQPLIQELLPPPFRESGHTVRAFFQPLTDIHLHSNLENEIEPNGDAATVYIFFAVGLFILLIACVNFMNLATARSAQRAREVGLRKVVGAHRRQLIPQFLSESVLMALVALVVAVLLVLVALPTFGGLAGKPIAAAELLRPGFVLLLLGVTVATGLLAGSYPALYLASFRPVAVLRGDVKGGPRQGARLREALIVFQFGVSLVLIISTLVVYEQMQYTQSMKLGFDKEHVVVIQVTDPNAVAQYPAYRDAVRRHPSVRSVTASLSRPGGLINQGSARPATAPEDASWQVHTYFGDFGLVETLDLEILAGRNLDPAYSTDSTAAVLINETAARAFGWHTPEEAVGKEIRFPGNPQGPGPRIVGVVSDFHSQSAHERIAPTIIGYANFIFFALVRIAPEEVPGTLSDLRATWEQIVPGYVFEYSFLDDDFDRLYRSEAVLGTLLGYFALLTVFIACLGLFGLASFTAEQRTKEIGVRKVMGATVSGLVLLLSKDFTRLVLVAFVVAAPVAYFAMRQWLANFAYHTTIGVGTFVAAGVVALAIAWLTVSYQAVKAALADPVRSLRYE